MESQSIVSILIPVLIIASIIFIKKKKNPNLVIFPKRITCPKCNTKQPIFRIPKNLKQTVFGGRTCPKCATELDQFGNIVK